VYSRALYNAPSVTADQSGYRLRCAVDAAAGGGAFALLAAVRMADRRPQLLLPVQVVAVATVSFDALRRLTVERDTVDVDNDVFRWLASKRSAAGDVDVALVRQANADQLAADDLVAYYGCGPPLLLSSTLCVVPLDALHKEVWVQRDVAYATCTRHFLVRHATQRSLGHRRLLACDLVAVDDAVHKGVWLRPLVTRRQP
jgi:hypothetical protein